MNTDRIITSLSIGLALSISTLSFGHEGHKAKKGPNGGSLTKVGASTVETVVHSGGIKFIVTDGHGKPLAAESGKGSLTLKVGTSSKGYKFQLKPIDDHTLGAAINLSKVEGHVLHLNVELQGVATSALKFHAIGKYHANVDGKSVSDEVLISLQGVCPVSGQKLGSMGAPPKIMVKGKPLFICCAGCKAKLDASPDRYLTKFYGSTKGEEVRPGVFKATLADTKAIATQKTCVVMDEPLGGMGTPLKVDVKGKAVFICCAGCAKKLTADPDKYLQQLAKAGIEPPAMN